MIVDAATIDLLQKVTLIPAVLIGIIVIYRDYRAAIKQSLDAYAAQIADLSKQVIVLNERIDKLLSATTVINPPKSQP